MKKLLIFLSFFSLRASVFEDEAQNFGLSFINNYGFSVPSRETREYHGCLLAHTRNSFAQLEQRLTTEGFQLDGRLLIMGYQEDAVPSYYTFDLHDTLDDEAAVVTESGSACTAHNVVGLATGFLLQDMNEVEGDLFQHIMPGRVGLFDDRAQLFQQHAFGDAYGVMQQVRKQMVQPLLVCDTRGVLTILRNFWRYAYVHNVVDGAGAPLATQNLLFSLYYARYLLDSSLPIDHIFAGPDITYPIELLPRQSLQATRGAQEFVQKFIQHLQPIDDQPTAYVFASFVDGVGKSTLLGNVKNFVRHGTAFAKYDRVDNASSQHATVFPVSDNVVIVDLPAQMSHVTFKPDGFVYVPVDTVPELEQAVCDTAGVYAQEHTNELIGAFCVCAEQLDDGKIKPDDPLSWYAYNALLLEREDVAWVPFVFEGYNFLFNVHDYDLRVLQPLAKAHSSGLKIKEPEQMLFTAGVSLPMSFDAFCDHVVDQLRAAGVQRVVFVDFLSMYPRTSRETIRVNFLLQQLKKLCGGLFDIDKSLYKHFVQPYEPLVLMRKYKQEVIGALLLETCLRWGLFDLIQEPSRYDVQLLSTDQLNALLHKHFARIYDTHHETLARLLIKKVVREQKDLEQQFATSKMFQAVSAFDPHAVVAFSDFLQQIFANCGWTCTVDDQYEVLYDVPVACRDTVVLQELFSTVRAHWYAALAQIAHVQTSVPPLLVRVHEGRLLVFRKKIKNPQYQEPFFPRTGELKTFQDIYAFGYQAQGSTPLSLYVQSFTRSNPQAFLSTTHLCAYVRAINLQEQGQQLVSPTQIPALRLLVRALATLELIIKDVQAPIMVRGNSKVDFVSCLHLLEQITLTKYFDLKVDKPLFDEYSTVTPVISWDFH